MSPIRTKLFGVLAVLLFISASISPARADQRDFRLINRGSTTIVSVYISAHGNPSWGSDALGSSVVYSGQYSDMYYTGPDSVGCMFDIRVVYADHAIRYMWNENLCADSAIYSYH